MIARILRGYRQRMDVSQERLAHLAIVERTYVGKVERGLLNPTMPRIGRLLGAMGVSWREFGEMLDRELDAASENRAAGRARRPPVRKAP
jgi:transcriptional regulator with XRE-family HTH domain